MEAVDAKMAHCEKEVTEVREENQKFYQISCERHDTYLNLAEDFAKHKLEVENRFEKYKSEINGKIIDHIQRIEQVKHYRQQLTDAVELHKKETATMFNESTEKIIEKLEV